MALHLSLLTTNNFMHWQTLTQFLQMGGYAIYVWPAYGITLIILIVNLLTPLQRLRQLRYQPKKHHDASTT